MEEIIPIHTDSYNSLIFIHPSCICVYKNIGYTPLQVVQDIKPFLKQEEISMCTYVGRLDPMAEGWMHVLWSGDKEEKNKLSSLNKIYEVDILLGIQTDTSDVLGFAEKKEFVENNIEEKIQSFVGPFTYPYPKYSSPHIKKTLKGEMVEDRLQKGCIDKIDIVGMRDISSSELLGEIQYKLSLCHMNGDFRLESIQEKWNDFFDKNVNEEYVKITVRVYCTSGTYMRTLAFELGGFALGIRRVGIGDLYPMK